MFSLGARAGSWFTPRSTRKRRRNNGDDTDSDDERRIRARRSESFMMTPSARAQAEEEERNPDRSRILGAPPEITPRAYWAHSQGLRPPHSSTSSATSASSIRTDAIIGRSLVRRSSSASMSTIVQKPSTPFPEHSAQRNRRVTATVVNFSLPPSPPSGEIYVPLACSSKNLLFFTRGNRVHIKNLSSTTSEDIGQFCRLLPEEKYGQLRFLEAGGSIDNSKLALATTKGTVQIWDIATKKVVSSFSTSKGVTAMKWNGDCLTVGSNKGTIRYYDTRINPSKKMKEQGKKLFRHQSEITCLAWNVPGRLLASGDKSGTVYVWDERQGLKAPLDVGDFVHRRKKIQHESEITAVAWSPWDAAMGCRFLATGDKSGVIRLWLIDQDHSRSNAANPCKIELNCPVTSINFSGYCKEFVTTHGVIPRPETEPLEIPREMNADGFFPYVPSMDMTMRPPTVSNAFSVYEYTTGRLVGTSAVSDKDIKAAVLNSNGTKLVVALPDESKIRMWDVWGKPREVRRQSSFMEMTHRMMRG